MMIRLLLAARLNVDDVERERLQCFFIAHIDTIIVLTIFFKNLGYYTDVDSVLLYFVNS